VSAVSKLEQKIIKIKITGSNSVLQQILNSRIIPIVATMRFQFTPLNSSTMLLSLEGSLIEQHNLSKTLEQISEITEPDHLNFIIDLSNIETMNSSGLNLLIHLLTKSRNAGGEAILICVPERLNNLLVMTKLNNVFTVAPNLEAALNILEEPASF
jgi:anti-sigma B factor antagonist